MEASSYKLANYLEDLWAKGFKLTDAEVRFIYFGKNYANALDWKVIVAIQTTLRLQYAFDRSFYLSLLELLDNQSVKNHKDAYVLFRQNGLFID